MYIYGLHCAHKAHRIKTLITVLQRNRVTKDYMTYGP